MKKNFTITNGKGFQMEFKSGYTLSVQWGVGNYCDNRDVGQYNSEKKSDFYSSTTAEIAVWKTSKDGESRTGLMKISPYDQVIGWLSTDDVAHWIAKVSNATCDEDIEALKEEEYHHED
jgi:hypothetical protein